MQDACDQQPSTMAAVLGLGEELIEKICIAVPDVVVPANYNCPGQVVISGSVKGIELAAGALKDAGAKRVLILNVAGAFHSPLMQPAQQRLEQAIRDTTFHFPECPVYQNVNALPSTSPEALKENVLKQLTAPVRWTQTIQAMIADGATLFTECGPGKVLEGLVRKIDREAQFAEL
jgi:[acyl-carrier-protein] S-malonyltransferase